MSAKDRSAGVAFALTFFFGPLGLLYVSVPVALVLAAVTLVSAVLTAGLSLVLLWPASIVWACIAASNRHSAFQRAMSGRLGIDPQQQAITDRNRQRWDQRASGGTGGD